MGADAPIPPVVINDRRPEGRPAAASFSCFPGPEIAQPCPEKGPVARNPPRILGFIFFYSSGVNWIGSCQFLQSIFFPIQELGAANRNEEAFNI